MSVYDRINAGEYRNTVPYSIEIVPVDEETMTVRQAREHRESEKERQRAQHRLHAEEEGRITARVRADLEAETGMSGHPKADAVWAKAWEDGHSSGYFDVASVYVELAELVKP